MIEGGGIQLALDLGDQVVGADEVDLNRRHISWLSPLARALMKSGPGDRVALHAPAGSEDLRILEAPPIDMRARAFEHHGVTGGMLVHQVGPSPPDPLAGSAPTTREPPNPTNRTPPANSLRPCRLIPSPVR